MIATLALLAAAAACKLPAGWQAVAARHTHYVVFGESHGTAEAPALVGDTACALAVRGERILVAIEQQATDDMALQRVWGSPTDGFADRLRALPNWAGRNDGVGSEAMFAMLVRLHILHAAGHRIDVVAFNGVRDEPQRARFRNLPGQGPHEAAQAENIRRAADAGSYDRVLVLTGNLHARTLPIAHGGATFEPMTMRLAPRADVTTLDMRSDGGSAWACQMTERPEPGKPIDWSLVKCQSYPISAVVSPGGKPRIALRPVTERVDLDPAYDGYFYVGPTTASPPEVP